MIGHAPPPLSGRPDLSSKAAGQKLISDQSVARQDEIWVGARFY